MKTFNRVSFTKKFPLATGMVTLFSTLVLSVGCGPRQSEVDPSHAYAVETLAPETPNTNTSTDPVLTSIETASQTAPIAEPPTTIARRNVLVGYTEESATASRVGSDRLQVIPAGTPVFVFPTGTDGYALSSTSRYRDHQSGLSHTAQNNSAETYFVLIQGEEDICGNGFDDNGNGSTDETCPRSAMTDLTSQGTSSSIGTASPVNSEDSENFNRIPVPSGTWVGVTASETSQFIGGRHYTIPAGSAVYVLYSTFSGYSLPARTLIHSGTYGDFRVPTTASSNSIYVVKVRGAGDLCGNSFDDNGNGIADDSCVVIAR
jgi:hypothetical protein